MKSFSEKALDFIKKIPSGKVMTYAGVARAIGHPRSARAVGNALNKNPHAPIVPCHRVIKSNGEIGGYASGAKKKIELLKKEGIKITNGKIARLKDYLLNMSKDKNTISDLQKDLRRIASPAKAKVLMYFFKTGPGQYGEGDKFLGVVVPDQRKLVPLYLHLDFSDLDKVIKSAYHEERLTGLLILVAKFSKAEQKEQAEIFKFYLSRTKFINNWDLVDLTADRIVGAYLEDKDKSIIFKLARSKDLWERRIAMLATFWYIKRGDPRDALAIAEILLNDKHDLIQKAVGWMLREIGKRCSEKIEIDFLEKHFRKMPRTMLRYAIERLPESKRKHFLKKD